MFDRRALRCLLIAVLAATLAAPASDAAAKPSRKKAIWGPAMVGGKSQFPIYRELGAGIYQYTLSWSNVTSERPADPRDPKDPAYHWPADLDYVVSQAGRNGMKVALVVQRTPGWSNGGQAENVPPTKASDYADFLEAASRRYRSVHLWLVFGEPIRFPNFLVHFKDARQRETNGAMSPVQKADAQGYAVLLDTAYGRLKRLNRRNLIVGGNTTTNGDFFGPFQWIKNLKLPDGRPPRMDQFGHNPFGSRAPDLRKDQIVPGTADFSDLDLLAGWLDRYLHRAGRNRKLPIFISEYTAPTDVPSFEFPFHVTRATQARWLAAGMRISRRWPRIYTLGWIGLYDAGPRADGAESRTGLITREGRRKPAFYAYKRG